MTESSERSPGDPGTNPRGGESRDEHERVRESVDPIGDDGNREGGAMSLVARLFGPLEVGCADGRHLGPRDFGGVKPKQVLEILLTERGRPVSKDRMADLLWGESLP